MIIKYYSDDGECFKTQDEATKHDEEVKAQKEKQKRLNEQKEQRWNEVEAAYKTASELYEQYLKDYGKTYHSVFPYITSIFNDILY